MNWSLIVMALFARFIIGYVASRYIYSRRKVESYEEAMYVRVKSGEIVESKEVDADLVLLDVDEKDEIVGVEIILKKHD